MIILQSVSSSVIMNSFRRVFQYPDVPQPLLHLISLISNLIRSKQTQFIIFDLDLRLISSLHRCEYDCTINYSKLSTAKHLPHSHIPNTKVMPRINTCRKFPLKISIQKQVFQKIPSRNVHCQTPTITPSVITNLCSLCRLGTPLQSFTEM